VGLVLLLVGVLCLGYLAYQYWGTNEVSRHAYDTEKDQLRASWQRESTPGPASTPASGQLAPPPMPGDVLGLLRIPALGADYEVPILCGTGLDVLSNGVGHYPSTVLPGQPGNFAVAGHRVTHGEPFRDLLSLNQGDEVVVETRAAVFTYVLDVPPRDLTVKAGDEWVLEAVPGRPGATPDQALLTLTTAQDLLRSRDRSVGFAHLASTRNKS